MGAPGNWAAGLRDCMGVRELGVGALACKFAELGMLGLRVGGGAAIPGCRCARVLGWM